MFSDSLNSADMRLVDILFLKTVFGFCNPNNTNSENNFFMFLLYLKFEFYILKSGIILNKYNVMLLNQISKTSFMIYL